MDDDAIVSAALSGVPSSHPFTCFLCSAACFGVPDSAWPLGSPAQDACAACATRVLVPLRAAKKKAVPAEARAMNTARRKIVTARLKADAKARGIAIPAPDATDVAEARAEDDT